MKLILLFVPLIIFRAYSEAKSVGVQSGVSKIELARRYHNLTHDIGYNDFIDYIDISQKSETHNMGNIFFKTATSDLDKKRYWQYFDKEDYLSTFKYKLNKAFKDNEITQIEKFYSKPYHAKYIRHFLSKANLYNLHESFNSLKLKRPNEDNSRIVFVRNIVILHLLENLISEEKAELKGDIEKLEKIFSIAKMSREGELEKKLEDKLKHLKYFKVLIDSYFFTSFSSYNKSEMYYMIGQLKNNKLMQRFANFAISYHYFYLKSYRTIYDKEQMKEEVSELKENFNF